MTCTACTNTSAQSVAELITQVHSAKGFSNRARMQMWSTKQHILTLEDHHSLPDPHMRQTPVVAESSVVCSATQAAGAQSQTVQRQIGATLSELSKRRCVADPQASKRCSRAISTYVSWQIRSLRHERSCASTQLAKARRLDCDAAETFDRNASRISCYYIAQWTRT